MYTVYATRVMSAYIPRQILANIRNILLARPGGIRCQVFMGYLWMEVCLLSLETFGSHAHQLWETSESLESQSQRNTPYSDNPSESGLINWKKSPSWDKVRLGWFPLEIIISVMPRWGRYNLSRSIVMRPAVHLQDPRGRSCNAGTLHTRERRWIYIYI